MKLIKTFKTGHKYFEDDQGLLHIADDSGDTPLETEDGDLIVDSARKIAAVENPYSVGMWGIFTIPLVTPEGEHTATLASLDETLFLKSKGVGLTESAEYLLQQFI